MRVAQFAIGDFSMFIDLYTKVVLTIIATALCVIAAQGTFGPNKALAMGGSCGEITDPCYVDTFTAIAVRVER